MYETDRPLPPYRGDRISFRPWWAVSFQIIWAALAFFFAAMFGWGALSGPHDRTEVWITAFAFAIGALFAVSILRTRIVLDADGIETTSLLGARRMRRSDVLGYRRYHPGRGRPELELRSRDPQAVRINVDAAVLSDPRCKPWFDNVEDLAGRDATEARASIDNDASLGATVEERRARASRIRTGYGVMFALGFGFVAFNWFSDQPGPWFFGLLLVYVVACYGLTFFGPPFLLLNRKPSASGEGGRFGTLNMLWFPALGCLPVLGYIHLADPQAWKAIAAICVAVAAGAVLIAGGLKIFRNGDWQVGLLAVAASAMCLFALAIGLNAVADRSTPALHRGTVANMRVRHYKSTSYRVDLAFADGKDREDVPKALYGRLKVGGPVCVAARPGLLHIAWTEVEAC